MGYFSKDVSKTFTDQMAKVLVNSTELFERWQDASGAFKRGPSRPSEFCAVLNEVANKIIIESMTQSIMRAWNQTLSLKGERTDDELESAGQRLGEMLSQEEDWKVWWMGLSREDEMVNVAMLFLKDKGQQLEDEKTSAALTELVQKDYNILLRLLKSAS
jgi:hypothetical protein